MRVYLDTNVLASAFATRGLCADVFRLVLMEHVLLTGEVNLVELRRVLRQRMKVSVETVDQVVSLLRSHVVVPRPAEVFAVPVRDRDDARVLASAVAGGADVLITGDKDLLEIEGRAPVRILTPRAFWDLVRRRRHRQR